MHLCIPLIIPSAEINATYVEIKNYVLKEHGLKVLICITQIKRNPEEKKAIVDAMNHFEMV